ncbi:MAG TPA: hypothetical protein VNZ52_04785 [Candidatus Thermoplasmatota archaeon]|nr:hypothetical protein [Candidatus Thermoplasmatota archaeon]
MVSTNLLSGKAAVMLVALGFLLVPVMVAENSAAMVAPDPDRCYVQQEGPTAVAVICCYYLSWRHYCFDLVNTKTNLA